MEYNCCDGSFVLAICIFPNDRIECQNTFNLNDGNMVSSLGKIKL